MRLEDLLPRILGPVNQVTYVANKGNAGDALIAASTAQVLERLNITVSSDAPVVLVAGGGNLHPSYQCLAKALSKLHTTKRVIILPSTVTAHWAVLKKFPNLLLLARDEMTQSLARLNGINSILCDDAAFSYRYPTSTECYGVLHAMRTDGESGGGKIPEGNQDISIDSTGWWHLHNSALAAAKFVNKINRHRMVSTDRCHVAIAAGMLGKRVIMKPGNYHKNKSVYQMSMSDMPNVLFDE